MTKKILLLGATFGTGNMGVGALTAGALRVLTAHPGVEVSFLDYGVEAGVSVVQVGGKTLRVPLINLRFSWKLLLPNNIATLLVLALVSRIVPAGLGQRVVAGNRWLAAIRAADAAVAVSGGDSFSDIYGMERFFYVCLPQLLSLLMGKELTLLPQTIGPFEGRLPRMLARLVMRRSKAVYSRDRQGVAFARAMLGLRGDDSRLRFCYDLGFLCEAHPPARADFLCCPRVTLPSGRPLAGLNVSGLLLMGGYGRDNAFALKVDYGLLVERIVQHLVEDKGFNVLLVPHVFGSDPESDTTALEAIQLRLGERFRDRLFRVRGTHDQSEIKHIIGRCDFFVGSRMHACIAALSQGIPAVAIAYSRKFAGVMQSIDVEGLVADPRRMDIDETLALIDRALDERDLIRARLEATMPRVREALQALSDSLA